MSEHDPYDDEQPDLDPPVDPPAEVPASPPERVLADARKAPPPRFPPDPLPPIILGGSINVIGSSPYAGKTPLIAWLIRQFTEGTVLGYPVPETSVAEHIYISAGSWETTTARWFTDLPVRPYSLQDDLAFSSDRLTKRRTDRLEVFEEALQQLRPKPGALIWLDPLTACFTGSILDPDVCYTTSFALHRLAIKYQFTLIGTAQGSKQKSNPQDRYTSLIQRIAGSAAFYSNLDTSLYLATPDECDRACHTLGLYPRHARQQLYDLMQDPETGRFAYATTEEGQTALQKAIPEPPASIHVTELQSLLCPPGRPDGMSRNTLYRHLRLLADRGLIRLVERGRYQKRKPN